MSNYAIYIRVSTKKQGQSGLGLESQRQICQSYIDSMNGETIAEFKDVESGTHRQRVGLNSALDFCKVNKCTLVIAKLDRLARDVEFTFKVMNMGIDIHFCDMPIVNTMILGVFATVGQYERELISARTKAGLKVRKQQLEQDGEFISKQGRIVQHLGSPKGFSENARIANAKMKREKAQKLECNVKFHNFIQLFEEKNGALGHDTPRNVFEQIAYEMNKLGYRTATNLEYNSNRVRALLVRDREIFGFVK